MPATFTTYCPICGQSQEWISRDHVPVMSKHEWRCVEVNPLMIWGARFGYYTAEVALIKSRAKRKLSEQRRLAKALRLTKM